MPAKQSEFLFDIAPAIAPEPQSLSHLPLLESERSRQSKLLPFVARADGDPGPFSRVRDVTFRINSGDLTGAITATRNRPDSSGNVATFERSGL